MSAAARYAARSNRIAHRWQAALSWYRGEGNANDQNNLNNGTPENGAAFTTGRVGQTFSLNGNGARIQLGNPAGLQLQNFSIEAWIKRSSSTIVTNNPASGLNAGTFIAYGTGGYGFIIDEPTGRIGLTTVGVSAVYSTRPFPIQTIIT